VTNVRWRRRRRYTRERIRTTPPSHAESPGNAHAVFLTRAYGEQRCARARCRATTKVARERDAPPSQQYNTIPDNGNDDDDGDDDNDGRTRTSIHRGANKTADVLPCVSDVTVAHARIAYLGFSSGSLDLKTIFDRGV